MLAVAGWVVASWGDGARSYDASRLRIAEVTRGDLVRDLSAEGRVIAANSPTLYAIAGGTVILKVVAGDRVEAGQVLAEIDSPELRSRLVQEESTLASLQAEADRSTLDARIARANARKLLDQAQIDRTAAERDMQRYQRAYDAGVLAQVELAKAEDTLKKTDIGLASAREDAGLQGQGAGLDARNRQLLADRQRAVVGEARRQVEALTLRAPFDGQVGQVQVAQHTNVAANAPVLGVVDLSVFEVEIRVPESFARDLAIGIPAEIRSGSEVYAAEVSAVSPEVVNGEVSARVRFSDAQPPGPAPEPAPDRTHRARYPPRRGDGGARPVPRPARWPPRLCRAGRCRGATPDPGRRQQPGRGGDRVRPGTRRTRGRRRQRTVRQRRTHPTFRRVT